VSGRAQVAAPLRRAGFGHPHLLIVVSLALFVAATNRWMSWAGGIRYLTARDVGSYEAIATAAPGLPDVLLPAHHAARFPVHWTVGTISALSGIPLHLVYRVALGAIVAVTLLLLHAIIADRLPDGSYVVVLAAFVLDPYTLRYDILVPGMLADAVFVLGIALAVFGLCRVRPWPVLAGMALAAAARETALLTVPVVIAWLVLAPAWRIRPPAARLALGGAVAVAVGAIFLTIGAVADGFSAPVLPGVHDARAVAAGYSLPGPSLSTIDDYTILGALSSPGSLAEHLARVATPLFTVLGLLAAAGLVGRRRGRGNGAPFEFWAALALAASIVVQPLLVSPAVLADNETRLAALALLPLAVALGLLIERVGPRLDLRSPSREAPLIVGVLAVASLHHLYTVVGPTRSAQMVPLELIGGAVAGWLLVRSLRRA
jgi:hypothetical protein